MKFDFKGFSKANGRVPIGEEGRKCSRRSREIGYDGWATMRNQRSAAAGKLQ